MISNELENKLSLMNCQSINVDSCDYEQTQMNSNDKNILQKPIIILEKSSDSDFDDDARRNNDLFISNISNGATRKFTEMSVLTIPMIVTDRIVEKRRPPL